MYIKPCNTSDYAEMQSLFLEHRNEPSFANLRVNRDIGLKIGKGPAMVLERILYWILPKPDGKYRCKTLRDGVPVYFTTYESLGEDLGMNERTLRRHVAILEDFCVIEKRATMSPYTRQKSMAFTLDMRGLMDMFDIKLRQNDESIISCQSEEDIKLRISEAGQIAQSQQSEKLSGGSQYGQNPQKRYGQNVRIDTDKMSTSTRTSGITRDIASKPPSQVMEAFDTSKHPNNPELEWMIRTIEAETDTLCPAYRKKLERLWESGDITPELLKEVIWGKRSGTIPNFPERSRYLFRHWNSYLRRCLEARRREVRSISLDRKILPESPPVVFAYRKQVDAVAVAFRELMLLPASSAEERFDLIKGMPLDIPAPILRDGAVGYFSLVVCHAAAQAGDEEFLKLAGRAWPTHMSSLNAMLDAAPELLGDYKELGWSEDLLCRALPFVTCRDSYINGWRDACALRGPLESRRSEALAAVALLEKKVPTAEFSGDSALTIDQIYEKRIDEWVRYGIG